MTPSELTQMYEDEIQTLCRAIDQAPFEDREFLYQWLSQQYHLVQNSTRYLAFAASRVGIGENAEFRDFAHHLREELDHDMTLLKDLKTLGYSEPMKMMPHTRAVIGAQYYDIDKNGPYANMGYALLLEGLSCQRCAVVNERIHKTLGFWSVYLKLHGEVDENHYPEGIEKLKKYDEKRLVTIANNLTMSSMLYQWFLQTVMESAAAVKPTQRLKKVA